MTEEQERKTEEEILFPGIAMYGHTVMPWTWDQFVLVASELLAMKKVLEKNDIGIESLFGADKDSDAIYESVVAIMPYIPAKQIISKTLGLDLKEISKWEFDKTAGILLVIVLQNLKQIKNLFGLAPQLAKLRDKLLAIT